MVWSAGSLPKRRRIVHAVRDFVMRPGRPALWLGEWVVGPSVAHNADDVAQWPNTPGLLVKWVSFLGSLHWPVQRGILLWVVFLMSSYSFFMSFGLERG